MREHEDIVRPLQRCKETARNVSSPHRCGLNKVTDVSEMPCRLIDDVHEGLTRSSLSLDRALRTFSSGEEARDFQWEAKTP